MLMAWAILVGMVILIALDLAHMYFLHREHATVETLKRNKIQLEKQIARLKNETIETLDKKLKEQFVLYDIQNKISSFEIEYKRLEEQLNDSGGYQGLIIKNLNIDKRNLEIENKYLKNKVESLERESSDEAFLESNHRKKNKEFTIDTAKIFRSPFKDYLLNFRHYVFKNHKVNIDFEVKEVDKGLEIRIEYKDEEELKSIQSWLDDFVKESQSVEILYQNIAKSSKKQINTSPNYQSIASSQAHLPVTSKDVQMAVFTLIEQIVKKTGGSFEVKFKINWKNEEKADEFASNIINGDPAIAEEDRVFLKALWEACTTSEKRMEVLEAVKEVREAEKNKTPLPEEKTVKLAELVGEFVKGVANTFGTKSFEELIKFIPSDLSGFITKNLPNLLS